MFTKGKTDSGNNNGITKCRAFECETHISFSMCALFSCYITVVVYDLVSWLKYIFFQNKSWENDIITSPIPYTSQNANLKIVPSLKIMIIMLSWWIYFFGDRFIFPYCERDVW